MLVLAVYSEAGGVTKTTTAVSLAMCAAGQGQRVALCDLDPRGAATKWIGAAPSEPGLHVGAILGNADPHGWFAQLAVPSGWHENLFILPSDREVSLREKEQADQSEVRLTAALDGADFDLVVIDCPNRQGGPLIMNALTAADLILYAARADGDGLVGVDGAMETVRKFKTARARIGAPPRLAEAGIIVGNVAETVLSRLARHTLGTFSTAYDGLLLTPAVPARVVVGESRLRNEWYGQYEAGQPVLKAYQKLTERVIAA
jgi:chromosome partitioning protein